MGRTRAGRTRQALSWRPHAAGAALVALAVLTGCSDDSVAPTSADSGTSGTSASGAPEAVPPSAGTESATPPSAAPSPTGPGIDTPPSPTESVAPVPDPPAPATIAPAERPGRPSGPRISAPPATVAEGVRYPDGVRVRVTGITPGEVAGEGPGVVAGPVTTFALTLINDSRARVDLGTVVMTLVYGEPGRLARPSYDVPTEDLVGFAAPGSTRRASYAFAVSTGDLSSYSLHVDLDGVHAPAVFTGPTSPTD